MRDTDARQTAADLHRLATEIEELADHADTLAEENVETSTANSLLDNQDEVQTQLKQLISNLIQLHTESGSIGRDETEHELGLNGSVPIPSNANTDLPNPSVGEPSRGGNPPGWANGGANTTGPAAPTDES